MKSFPQIVQEVGKWSEENFGRNATNLDTPTGSQVVYLDGLPAVWGILEEIGELMEAANLVDQQDAIGDIGIYLADYMHRWGIPPEIVHPKPCNLFLSSVGGRLAHLHLKRVQGIRGMDDDVKFHEAQLEILSYLLFQLNNYCEVYFKRLFIEIVNETWENVVSKRNWKKKDDPQDPPTGNVPAQNS